MKQQRVPLRQFVSFNKGSCNTEQKKPTYQRKIVNLPTEVYEDSQSVDKQNQSTGCRKKLRLKLKTNPSKDLQRNTQTKSLIASVKVMYEKSDENNSGLKAAFKIAQNTLNQNGKKRKIESNFKPNVVYFSLKSLKQSIKPNVQIKQTNLELKNSELKQKSKTKNYQLSSFLSEVIFKLAQLYPQTFCDQTTLTTLSSQEVWYSDLMKILFSLGMIRYPSQEKYRIGNEDQKTELQKVYLLWKILKSNLTPNLHKQTNLREKKAVNLVNVVILLTVIFNVNFDTVRELVQTMMEKVKQISAKNIKIPVDHQYKNQHHEEPNCIFFIRNKTLVKQFEKIRYQDLDLLNPDQKTKSGIAKEFEPFRVNRLKIYNHPKPNKENLELYTQETQTTIQSLLSPKSQQLAMTRRFKILQEIQNSQEIFLTKESICQSELNFFLNYKNHKNCNHNEKQKISQELFKNQGKQNKNNQIKQKITVINKNGYIPSQKIKFSQLNAIQNMQKARQLKLEKKIILQKGWTNSAQTISNQSKLNSTLEKRKEIKEIVSGSKRLQKSKSLSKKSQSKRNFFQNRKNSIQSFGKNSMQSFNKKDEIGFLSKISSDEMTGIEKRKKYQKMQDLIEDDSDEINTFIQHSSEESNDTLSVDENESLDLENRHFSNDQDFLIEHDEPFQMTDYAQKIQANYSDPQQNMYEPESSSKTFNTQVNEQIDQEDQASAVKKLLIQDHQSQQTRVIKSYLKIPILYVDVNMDESKKERIIIYEEDNPTKLAHEFGRKHGLDGVMIGRLQEMIKEQISGILGRIDEEEEDQYEDTKEDVFDQKIAKKMHDILEE